MEATYRRPPWLSGSDRPRSADGGPQVICQTWNDYGRSDATHDEMGYLLGSRPCIYGWTKDGFIPPPVVRATDQLMSLKMSNNTHARFGDMGLWEIKGALVPVGLDEGLLPLSLPYPRLYGESL
jgi:hypothetical protein